MARITWFSILLCFASAQNETLLANDNILDQIGFGSILPGVNDDSEPKSFVTNLDTSQELLDDNNSSSFGRGTTSHASNSRNADDELPGTSDEKKYECPFRGCAETLKTRAEYNKHFKAHGKPFIYECKQCGNTYKNRQSFSYHKDAHKPRFQCTNCSKSFKYLGDLRKHEHMCHGAPHRHYKCLYPACNEHFVDRRAFERHRACHKEPFLYECKYSDCKKIFEIAKNYYNHKRTHVPKALCTMCGKSFQQESMKHHMECCRRALEHEADTSKDLTQLNAQIGHSSRRDEGPGTSSVTSQNEWVNTDFPEYFDVPDDFYHVLSSIGRNEN